MYVCVYIYMYMCVYIYMYVYMCVYIYIYIGFSDGSAGKKSTCNAGDKGDWGSIPEAGRFLGVRNWQPTLVFLPKKIPRTEEPVGLQSRGGERVGHD